MSLFKVFRAILTIEMESVRLCGRDIATIQTNSDAERAPHQIKRNAIERFISFSTGIGTSSNLSVELLFHSKGKKANKTSDLKLKSESHYKKANFRCVTQRPCLNSES